MSSTLGLKLLRLAPLVISSATLMCAIDQSTALNPFTKPHPPLANKKDTTSSGLVVLPRWFRKFVDRIVLVIVIAYPLAISTAFLNTLVGSGSRSWILRIVGGGDRPLDARARGFYYAGMLFSAGHFLYGPYAMRLIKRVCDEENVGDGNVVAAREWVGMNRARIATVDFWGWVMYLCAVVSAVEF